MVWGVWLMRVIVELVGGRDWWWGGRERRWGVLRRTGFVFEFVGELIGVESVNPVFRSFS